MILLAITAGCLALGIVAVFLYATMIKKRLEASASGTPAGTSLALTISEPSVASLQRLSLEPLFLKVSVDKTRVQIDKRPLVPLTFLTDQAAVAALREVVAAVGAEFGVAAWSGLVTTHEDGSVVVQRLT